MADTKLRILDAAARAFAEKGFHRATVRQIAADARVNEITVFRYFPEKHDLYWAAVDRKVRQSKLLTSFAEAIDSSATPEDLVYSTSSCLFRLLGNDKDLARLLHFTFLELEVEKRRLWDGVLRPILDSIKDRMSGWVEGGQLRAVDPEAATRALIGFVISQHMVGTIDGSTHTFNPEKFAATNTDLSLFGLLPR